MQTKTIYCFRKFSLPHWGTARTAFIKTSFETVTIVFTLLSVKIAPAMFCNMYHRPVAVLPDG